jgi:hypothetical protein
LCSAIKIPAALTVSALDNLRRPEGRIDFVCKILASWRQGAEGIPVRNSRRRRQNPWEIKQHALSDGALHAENAEKKPRGLFRSRLFNLALLLFYCTLVWVIILFVAGEALIHAPEIAAIAPQPH